MEMKQYTQFSQVKLQSPFIFHATVNHFSSDLKLPLLTASAMKRHYGGEVAHHSVNKNTNQKVIPPHSDN